MKVYVVVSAVTSRTGATLEIPVGAYEDRGKAEQVAGQRNRSLLSLLDCKLVGTDGEEAGMTLKDVLADIGIGQLQTGAIEMPVEATSLIAIPRFMPKVV